MKNILIAVDGSQCALRAVDYIGHQFSGVSDVKLTLLHVLPYVPTAFWDDGHILTKKEKETRKEVVDKWLENQRLRLDPIFNTAIQGLIRRGIKQEQIETKTISDSQDVAGSILEEARNGGYLTLVLGRCGLSPAKRFLMGSVTTKILNHGAGIAICIVE